MIHSIFRYSIEDLTSEQNFLVNLNIQICFDAKKPCLTDLSVFKNTKLPKKPCEWRTGFLNEGKHRKIIFFQKNYVAISIKSSRPVN